MLKGPSCRGPLFSFVHPNEALTEFARKADVLRILLKKSWGACYGWTARVNPPLEQGGVDRRCGGGPGLHFSTPLLRHGVPLIYLSFNHHIARNEDALEQQTLPNARQCLCIWWVCSRNQPPRALSRLFPSRAVALTNTYPALPSPVHIQILLVMYEPRVSIS